MLQFKQPGQFQSVQPKRMLRKLTLEECTVMFVLATAEFILAHFVLQWLGDLPLLH